MACRVFFYVYGIWRKPTRQRRRWTGPQFTGKIYSWKISSVEDIGPFFKTLVNWAPGMRHSYLIFQDAWKSLSVLPYHRRPSVEFCNMLLILKDCTSLSKCTQFGSWKQTWHLPDTCDVPHFQGFCAPFKTHQRNCLETKIKSPDTCGCPYIWVAHSMQYFTTCCTSWHLRIPVYFSGMQWTF